jgi:hypothetical protein
MVRWFAEAVHNQSMAVGLKNAGNLLADWNDDGLYNTKWQSQLVKAFDFNVIESCVCLSITSPIFGR